MIFEEAKKEAEGKVKLTQMKVFSEGDLTTSVMDIAKRMLVEALKLFNGEISSFNKNYKDQRIVTLVCIGNFHFPTPEAETSYGLEKDVGGLYSGVLMAVLLVFASGLLFSVFIGDVLETADIYCTTFEKIADYSTAIIVYVWV